ncbi:MAG TPA: cytochrome c biogenesis protein CcsA [Polyangiaceae bacterium]|nr:cytochrome c biogenesis protein CcsA [Polyangiaceae bacterium]
MTLQLANILFAATVAVYLGASVLFAVPLLSSDGSASRASVGGRWAPRLLSLGVPLHAAHIIVWSIVLHVCPVEGIHFALSVGSMFACAAYLLVRRRYRIDAVGAFVAPQALAFLLASRFVGGVDEEPRLRSALLPFHVVSNLLGIALFTLAFAAAVAYLLQNNHLKHKSLEAIERLPPIEALDRAEHRFLVAAFPLLTIGVLTGTIWAREVEAGGPADIARAALSYACWAFIGAVLLLRAAAGWRGRRAALGTIFGFGLTLLVLVAYLIRSVMGAGGTGGHA